MADIIDQAKRAAAFRAVDETLTSSTRIIGIGSGSTIVHAVERIAHKFRTEFIPIVACIPTSFQAQSLILEAGLPLGTLYQYTSIDVTYDGADDIDPSLNLIKGGGACHLTEKLVASASKTLIILADDRKLSPSLCGGVWKSGIPVEVIPSAVNLVLSRIHSTSFGNDTVVTGCSIRQSVSKKAGPVITDTGNMVIDIQTSPIKDPSSLHTQLIGIVGVVETGLFCGMTSKVYLGMQDGSVKVLNQQS